jgi:hypothetical protein
MAVSASASAFALVALLTTNMPAARDNSSDGLWPHPSACKLHVEAKGNFDDGVADLANYINAPPFARHPSGSLGFSPEVLTALNAQRDAVFEQVLKSLHLSFSRNDADLKAWDKSAEPMLEGQNDRYFDLRVEIAGATELGGRHAGNEMRFSLRSLHRANDIVGEASVTVPVSKTADTALDGLRAAIVQGVTGAFTSLRSHLDDEKNRPRATMTLVVALDGLSTVQRDWAARGVARCAVDLLSPLMVSVGPANEHEVRVMATYRLKAFDPDETEADRLQAFVGTLALETGSHGKCRCSSWQTPLQGWVSHVDLDLAHKTVTLRYTLPDENDRERQ